MRIRRLIPLYVGALLGVYLTGAWYDGSFNPIHWSVDVKLPIIVAAAIVSLWLFMFLLFIITDPDNDVRI